MKIYVGNLSYNVGEDQLKDAFGQYGNVESAKIITDKFSGRSKGFGFVEMSEAGEAENAINSLNDTDLDGRAMKVSEARELDPSERKPFRPSNNNNRGGGGGYGGGGNRGGGGGNRRNDY